MIKFRCAGLTLIFFCRHVKHARPTLRRLIRASSEALDLAEDLGEDVMPDWLNIGE